MFRIFSSAFAEGAAIPRLHTCDGADLSPSLEWSDPPSATGSFGLLMEDPDAPDGTWTHWILWDLPAGSRNLPQGGTRIGIAGTNDFGKSGYGGPCPPPGKPHRYYFRLFALAADGLALTANSRRAQFDKAIAGKVLAEAACMGRFSR
jgi:Raf kinase inhibitor-like YbhB/YbcL family protein